MQLQLELAYMRIDKKIMSLCNMSAKRVCFTDFLKFATNFYFMIRISKKPLFKREKTDKIT